MKFTQYIQSIRQKKPKNLEKIIFIQLQIQCQQHNNSNPKNICYQSVVILQLESERYQQNET